MNGIGVFVSVESTVNRGIRSFSVVPSLFKITICDFSIGDLLGGLLRSHPILYSALIE
jgi:hypothetical protein